MKAGSRIAGTGRDSTIGPPRGSRRPGARGAELCRRAPRTNRLTPPCRTLEDSGCSEPTPLTFRVCPFPGARMRFEESEDCHRSSSGSAAEWPADPEDQVRRLIPTPLRVHLAGETGSGKNHMAYFFRAEAEARSRPFVEINVANLPDDLFEAEFFGTRRGAFTGAAADRPGLLDSAAGGVLFLNEVGELSAAAQAKLLTVLDGGLYRRLGDPHPRRFEARIISATNRDLRGLAVAGDFRPDLYFRLAQFTVMVPPLRERRPMIPRLATAFLAEASRRRGMALRPGPGAMRLLTDDPWPGNVRELRDTIEVLSWLAPGNGIITREAVRACRSRVAGEEPATPSAGGTLREMVERLERRAILQALIAAGGNKTRAARQLGLSVPGLRLKLRRLQLP